MKYNRLHTLSAAIILFTAGTAMANERREPNGPPPEAIEACEGLAVDQACEFTGRRNDTVSGVCASIETEDTQALACKPSGGRPEGGQRRSSDR